MLRVGYRCCNRFCNVSSAQVRDSVPITLVVVEQQVKIVITKQCSFASLASNLVEHSLPENS